ncbi:glycoside hydrolase family 71 protein [Aspergillus mulundensis]|uniref:Putative alpha 1,3 glucanase GH71 n=1 Tax=Aspergillus mulundensis TaxID=1810919 RepID=A0A3D8S6F6_9EURO|nr:putative alpha 1,3 glucanase GH71 [Aspergillus mulundensis]RDW81594.1 putative alpha 1,3 glucanase GH71 [Aspergillus mulundensis]
MSPLRAWGLPILALLSSSLPQIQAKSVFAHFMVANTQNYTLTDWKSDITLAKASSLDAFALNAGFNQSENALSFHHAFAAAAETNFKLFFSLDYSGNASWPKDQVIALLSNYTTHPAYFRHTDGRALVGTFEGFEAAPDWADIKERVARNVGSETCCAFIPDWTSAGPQRASSISSIDGLMSWDAWPYGAESMNTTMDEAYMSALDSKAYIMPVSPWFYTNLRQFNKNWVWRGDDLWYTRWQQVLELQPEYVEILTWNDYGESHYIGPVRRNATGVIDRGAPFDYVADMPHDGWRSNLPFLIGEYKNGTGKGEVEVEEENLSVWYRLSPGDRCDDGGTSGNSESSGEVLMKPGEVLQDKVFYSAVLDGWADVRVAIGGVNRSADWSDTPDGGKGVYHGSAPFDGRTGEVEVTLSRDGELLAQMKGRRIEDSCPGNYTNWNAWVGNVTAVRRSDENGGMAIRIQRASLWVMGLALLSYLM